MGMNFDIWSVSEHFRFSKMILISSKSGIWHVVAFPTVSIIWEITSQFGNENRFSDLITIVIFVDWYKLPSDISQSPHF